MPPLPGAPVSYWLDSAAIAAFQPLDGDLTTDVVVVGGGLVGVTTAHLLARAGHAVVLLEADRIAAGVTGNTTGKLTAGHGRIYKRLTDSYGAPAARAYARSNQDAVEWVASQGIDCDLRPAANYIYTDIPEDVESLRDEATAARAAGLPASFVTESPLPVPVLGAVRLDEQAQFHPRRFIAGMVDRLTADGVRIIEGTRVTGVHEGRVDTDAGRVTARAVVVATNAPIIDRGLHFALTTPKRSYVVAGRVDAAAAPADMHISTAADFRSIRTNPEGDDVVLIVGGRPHKTGQEPDTIGCYQAVATWARETLDLHDIEWRWSTHDPASATALPFIGKLWAGSHIYVATGFAGWGMTKSVVAAQIITDAVSGRPNPYARLYGANNWHVTRSAGRLVRENLNVAKHFLTDRLKAPEVSDLATLGAGEGAIARHGGKRVAAFRDDDGTLSVCSATCTHLACVVAWNPAERSWDCPCHGSRFTTDGEVIQGPATKPLARIDVEVDG